MCPPFDFRRLPAAFQVVAEGDDWLVVDKPPHVQVHPSKPSDIRTLWHSLRDLLAYELVCGGQVSLINRLDRETSGLTLVAKTHLAARRFHLAMQHRAIQKAYLAVVWGWPGEPAWECRTPILRQGEQQTSPIYLKQMVHPAGVAAHTSFAVVQRFSGARGRYAVVRAVPHTGRMHQIRVHLASAGVPVVGDKLYGPDEQCYLEFIQTGWTAALAERLELPRHALHSAEMAIPSLEHTWQAPLAADLAEFLAGLHPEPL